MRSVGRFASELEAELRQPANIGNGSTRALPGPASAASGASASFDLVTHTRQFYRELMAEAPEATAGDGSLAAQIAMLRPVRATEMAAAVVAAPGTPLRDEPSSRGHIIATATKDAQADVLAASGAWRKVLLSSGAVGWVFAEMLSAARSTSSGAADTAIVPQAMRYIGVPYLWGGETRAGMDCSGLVFTVMGSLGKRVPRTAGRQYAVGSPVSRQQLRPGDLVFFTGASGPSISHVGIYTGGGKFIHASSGIGKVAITPLDSPYYKRHYIGARRLLS